MNITYQSSLNMDTHQLQRLFLSLNWESGKHPEKLKKALSNYSCVFTAWEGEKLIGLVGCMDDGVMTAYIHYLLVDPSYQGYGIGQKLIELVKEHYRFFLKIVLVAYDSAVPFYLKQGFEKSKECTPMEISCML